MSDTLELPGLPPAPPEAPDAPPADELPAPTPARRGRRRTPAAGDKPKAPRSRRTPAKAQRVDIAAQMSQLYTIVGAGIAGVPSGPSADGAAVEVEGQLLQLTVTQRVGMEVVTQADECGKAWAALAETDDRVRLALERFLTVSAFGAVIAAHMPMVLAAGMATGAVPPFLARMLAGAQVAQGGASA